MDQIFIVMRRDYGKNMCNIIKAFKTKNRCDEWMQKHTDSYKEFFAYAPEKDELGHVIAAVDVED